MNLELPNDIYLSVLSEVERILCRLDELPADEHYLEAKNNAAGIFRKLSDELRSNIESLSKNAEWDTFTIAFYGETNAGKSTVIETLRILLEEPRKLEEQTKFRELQERFGISPEQLAALREAVARSQEFLEQFQQKLNSVDRQHQLRTQDLGDRLKLLQRAIAMHMENATLWQKFLDLFIKLPEQKQIVLLESELQEMETDRMKQVLSLQQEQVTARENYASCERQLKEAESEIARLAAHADGAIIGNGQSDFTKDTTSYALTSGGQEFALLDVPGIEGKEASVIDAVWAGVQKAHAVFYVTGKAAAPQKGEGQQQGTLEKIRQHLGAQTEVWTVYNKRVTNPIQLGSSSLTNEDEQASLRELDARMTEALGDTYRGTVTVSAYPAFLAAASCLVPDSQPAIGQAKFMAKLDRQQLLKKSGMSTFHDLLASELVRDFRAKIIRSNFNKANKFVHGTREQVASTLQQSFKPLAKELKKDAAQAHLQLDTALDALKTRLDAQGESAISAFTNAVRKRIYEAIDGDIGNDEFKDTFERIIRREQTALVEKLPGLMQQEVRKFQDQIGDIVERFQKFAADLVDAYGSMRVSSLGANIELKIDIHNGINIPGLLGALAGGVLMIWNPAGWVVLALGAVTVLVGAVKAVIGFFSSDYKKSQQRKSADSNLEGITDKLRESLRESLEAALPQLEPKIEALKDALDKPAAQVADIVAILGKSERQLKKLSQDIETKGDLKWKTH